MKKKGDRRTGKREGGSLVSGRGYQAPTENSSLFLHFRRFPSAIPRVTYEPAKSGTKTATAGPGMYVTTWVHRSRLPRRL